MGVGQHRRFRGRGVAGARQHCSVGGRALQRLFGAGHPRDLFGRGADHNDGIAYRAGLDRKGDRIPKTFFEYKLATRVFGCCHEILHCMFAHCTQLHHLSKKGVVKYADGKELPFDNETFQRSMDAVINAILVASNVGEIDPAFVLDIRIPADMSVLDAYRVMYVKQPPQPKSQPTPGGKPGGYDEHLRPGQAEGKDENEAEGGRNRKNGVRLWPLRWRPRACRAVCPARWNGSLGS